MVYILLLVIGFGAGYWAGRRTASPDPKLKQVLALFNHGREVYNDEVQSALGVSDATATRYLDALEKSGDIKQVGSTGRGVTYRKK